MNKRPIMIMAGGTGGHVFPALAVADYLKKKDVPILWLGTKKGLEARVVPEAGYVLKMLSISGVRGKGITTRLLAPFRIVFSILQAMGLMIRNRPAAVLGMGGFVSGPGGVAAWLMRVPLFVHEQNAIVGMTNRLLAKISTQAFEAFPGAFDDKVNAMHVGNPVRQSILEIAEKKAKLKRKNNQIRILIVGGSLGARKLNQLVPVAISMLKQEVLVWHQTGQQDCDRTRENYKALRVQAKVEAFLNEIDRAYCWADLVICRSGALTVSELATAGLPAILIPYPYAVDDHQTVNARYLVDAGAAVMIDEKDLTVESLNAILKQWLSSTEKLQQLAKSARQKAMNNATEYVGDCCYEVAYG